MKIVLIYSGYSEKLISGITNYVQGLKNFLDKKGHQVYLLPGKKYKNLPPFLGLYWQIVKPFNYFVLKNFLNQKWGQLYFSSFPFLPFSAVSSVF